MVSRERLEWLGRGLVVLGTIAALEVLLVVLVAAWWLPPADGAAPAARESRYSVRVDVVDQTDGTWPLEAVVREWDRSRNLELELVERCSPGTYCVRVRTGDYGTEWMGGAAYRRVSRSAVLLNNNPAVSQWTADPVVRSGVVCHELAHTFGIQHPAPSSSSSWGCMTNSDHAHTTALPSFRDRRLMASYARTPERAVWGAVAFYAWKAGQ